MHSREKFEKVQCAVTTLNKYPPSFRGARTFPQRLRLSSSCAWSRLTASRLSLLAPERLWGRGRERGKNASVERAVLELSIGYHIKQGIQTIRAQQCPFLRPQSRLCPFAAPTKECLATWDLRALREIPASRDPAPQPCLTRLSEGGVRRLQVDCISNT